MPYTIGIIGGTDSSGGSGIAADKKTTLDNNCIALPVITAITFQNSPTRLQIHAVPRIGLRNQLDSLSELSLNVIKIGMLPDIDAVDEVKSFLVKGNYDKVILDPIKKSSSGHDLISEAGWLTLVDSLLPHVDLVTPNIDEAISILNIEPRVDIDPYELATKCLDTGPKHVLLKGGHLNDQDRSKDVLIGLNLKTKIFDYERVDGGTKVRGTGCRLASAIACEWARHDDIIMAVEKAGGYLQNYIREAVIAPKPF